MRNHLEAIFDEPDLLQDADESLPKATTYFATVTRTGKQWTATVTDLPGGGAVQAQGAYWTDVRRNLGSLLLDALKAEPGTVALHLAPADPEAADVLTAVTEARIARAQAEQAERDAVRHAARTLIGKSWNTRDAGTVLGLSHQRISQIAPRATA
ncbi:hypothetical protein ACFOY2_46135 [Nonomuraea purpurea]|uniref:Type II toxin-antitoxin system HicB family antitoxin n=1 Tax=Nonomuraea purpurea TaxID=1849276 RepID=A0ABV8GL61_9ACTN